MWLEVNVDQALFGNKLLMQPYIDVGKADDDSDDSTDAFANRYYKV